MELAGSIEELQKVADYRTILKTLRPAGIGSIIFGLISIVMGAVAIEENPLNAVLAFIGIFLLVEGTWLVIIPTPKGMIVDGIALLVLGGWNIFITIYNASIGASQHSLFAVIGVFQILWGLQSFKRYKRSSGVSMEKPSGEAMRNMNDLVKNIRSSKPKNEPDIIQFQINEFQSSIWKGKLFSNTAVFIMGRGQETIIVKKEDVAIETQEKTLIGKSLKASFQFGGRNFKGTIAPEFFEKYAKWKTGIITGANTRS